MVRRRPPHGGGRGDLVSLWGDDGRMRLALREADGAPRRRRHALRPRRVSLGRGAASAGEPARAGGLRPLRLLRARRAGRTPLARSRPLAAAPSARATGSPTTARPDAYAFLEAKGPGLHQIPVGPVHAGIIEPGHFRFHAGGEAVVRLEERLGYTHKGVDALMRGASLERARRTRRRA